MGLTTIPAVLGKQYNSTYISASGTYTVPAGTDGYLDIWAVGGGGGGGRDSNGATGSAGGGGAPGIVNYLAKIPVTAGTVLTITIGGGGNGRTTANGFGSTGSNTTIAGFAADSGGSQTLISYGGKGGASSAGSNTTNDQVISYYGFTPVFDSGSQAFNLPVAQIAIGFNGSFTYAQPNNCNYAGATSFSRLGYGGRQFLKNNAPTSTSYGTSAGFDSELGVVNFPLAYLHATQGSAGGTSNGTGGSSTANSRFAGQGGNGNQGASAGGAGVGGGGGGGGGSNAATTAGAGGAASANSGAGGGGGGGGSSASSISGNGGNGGSGFVIISGWY